VSTRYVPTIEDLESQLTTLKAENENLKLEKEKLEWGLESIQEEVNIQAEDEGLWCIAQCASEDYIQRGLRKLHYVIEKQALLEQTSQPPNNN